MTAIATKPATTADDATRSSPRASAEGLIRLVEPSPHRMAAKPSIGSRAARALVLRLLGRMTRDSLTLIDHCHGSALPMEFGPRTSTADAEPLHACIEILDGRAWTALVREGSVGLGRGYIERWWDSPDPEAVVRVIIRNIEWIDETRNRIAARTGWVTDRVRSALPTPDRSRNREDIASHYDLGNDFFEIFLDETMTYSSGVFASPDVSMADASLAKYDRILSKLGVTAEHSVLEIGTGWGGFALRAVDTTGCSVTTTTISKEQLKEASRRVQQADRSADITVIDKDWRDLDGSYDRLASIEMIEAVDWRDYDHFFSTIERCLKPDGVAAIQAICVPDRRYERTKNTEDFIRRFVFPGGFLPSTSAINRSVARATRLQIVDVEDISAHYAETLRRWRTRFDERINDVTDLGFDERFCRLWRFYLAYCEAGFRERHCTLNQIVFAGPRWRPDGTGLREC